LLNWSVQYFYLRAACTDLLFVQDLSMSSRPTLWAILSTDHCHHRSIILLLPFVIIIINLWSDFSRSLTLSPDLFSQPVVPRTHHAAPPRSSLVASPRADTVSPLSSDVPGSDLNGTAPFYLAESTCRVGWLTPMAAAIFLLVGHDTLPCPSDGLGRPGIPQA